jgi:hypothetical protein
METLSYFSHPDPSIWLSVDPQSDKYPNLTPYAYCANNPVVLVDPDGRKDRPFNAKTDKPITPQKGTETPIYSFDKNGKAIGLASGWTSAYNCHSYAWHNSKGDTDPADGDIPKIGGVPIPKWDNNPADDIKQQNARQLGSDEKNIPGDIVIYYTDASGNEYYDDGEPISHSAVVKTVDNEGYTTTVIGKMGQNEISENHPDAPHYYNKDKEGNSTSRAYILG